MEGTDVVGRAGEQPREVLATAYSLGGEFNLGYPRPLLGEGVEQGGENPPQEVAFQGAQAPVGRIGNAQPAQGAFDQGEGERQFQAEQAGEGDGRGAKVEHGHALMPGNGVFAGKGMHLNASRQVRVEQRGPGSGGFVAQEAEHTALGGGQRGRAAESELGRPGRADGGPLLRI